MDYLIDQLYKPLPQEAIKQHPSRKYLSTINAIYVTDRLNDVFGVGGWSIKTSVVEQGESHIVVHVTFTAKHDELAHDLHLEQYGGNDNADRGDAYKGAVTDALTKICSMIGIGAHVWKNDPQAAAKRALLVLDENDQLTELGQKAADAIKEGKTTVEAIAAKYILTQKDRQYLAKL